jgi:hypothetical protein
VLGGVITSTILTLVVVPIAYTFAAGLQDLPGRIRRRREKPPASPAEAASAPAER